MDGACWSDVCLISGLTLHRMLFFVVLEFPEGPRRKVKRHNSKKNGHVKLLFVETFPEFFFTGWSVR